MKKLTLKIPVRFRDLDAMGHVNNATIVTYLEEGRKEFFVQVLKSARPEDFPFVLASISCAYLQPIPLTDKMVEEALWISHIGRKSFVFNYEIYRPGNPAWRFAEATSVQVYYDYQKAQSVLIPGIFKSKIQLYYGEP